MKKFKIVLVSVVALILCLLCVTGNTFSWFSRPKELSGKQLDLTSKKYFSSVLDNIEIKSYSSSDGVNYGTTEVKGFSETSGVASGARKYYRTDIYNFGANAQSVSLYLESLNLDSNAEGLSIGVNGPTKTFKKLSSDSALVVDEIYKQNVYLGLHEIEVNEGKLTNNVDFVHAWNNNEIIYDAFWSDISDTGSTANYIDTSGWKQKETYKIYAVPIDSRCNYMKLKSKYNGWINTEAHIYDSSTNEYKNNTIIFYEYGNRYYVDAVSSDFNSRLDTFYSSATVKTDQTVNLAATYHGKSISYSSSNNNIATVSSSGVVTGVSAGTAIITVKVYGIYGDCIESDCIVTVTSSDDQYNDVPIVTNVNVQPSVVDAYGETQPSISIYWYIKNDSDKNAMTYNISNLYLTL